MVKEFFITMVASTSKLINTKTTHQKQLSNSSNYRNQFSSLSNINWTFPNGYVIFFYHGPILIKVSHSWGQILAIFHPTIHSISSTFHYLITYISTFQASEYLNGWLCLNKTSHRTAILWLDNMIFIQLMQWIHTHSSSLHQITFALFYPIITIYLP